MKRKWQPAAALCTCGTLAVLGLFDLLKSTDATAYAQATPTPTQIPAAPPAFDNAAALARLREQIKGKEQLPSTEVFKNIQTPFIRSIPAGRVLSVMDIAYSRSLGVGCDHCHIPDKWESDENPKKQIARDMAAMMATINGQLLKNIKNLPANPTVNCTTCHRGQVKPALNLQPSK